MKNTLLLIIFCSCSFYSLYAANNGFSNESDNRDEELISLYRQFSSTTDPGEYIYLFEDLPDSLPELCSLIRSQFVHPYSDLPKYREQFPKERWNEMTRIPNVKSILEGLVSYDSSGLTKERQVDNRLILGCWHNSILLASILKSRGIPARVRYGHATYIAPEYHISHTICEVWNKDEKRWMLVDPSMDMVDFSRDIFDLSNDAWLQLQRKEIDPSLFGVPGRYSGIGSIAGKICGDLASVLGTEHTIFEYAPILDFIFDEEKQLSEEQINLLNKVCELMQTLDADNIAQLQEIYNNTPELQITKSMFVDSGKSSKNKER